MRAFLLGAFGDAVCHPLQPTQGPSDGNITFADAAGAIISQGPVQGVSVGHVGRAMSFEAQGGTYGLGTGTHTGAFLRPSLSDLQSPCQLPQDTHQLGSCLGCQHVGRHACKVRNWLCACSDGVLRREQ